MKLSLSRRVAAIGGIAAVVAVVATAAYAATLSNNARSLPSANPTDLRAASGRAWTRQLAPSAYIGLTTASTTTWGNPTTSGGGSLTISRQVGNTITITITSLDTGLIIPNAMVTASGGQTGATRIVSTAISSNRMRYTIRLYAHEGTPPQLNLKWYTTQLMM